MRVLCPGVVGLANGLAPSCILCCDTLIEIVELRDSWVTQEMVPAGLMRKKLFNFRRSGKKQPAATRQRQVWEHVALRIIDKVAAFEFEYRQQSGLLAVKQLH